MIVSENDSKYMITVIVYSVYRLLLFSVWLSPFDSGSDAPRAILADRGQRDLRTRCRRSETYSCTHVCMYAYIYIYIGIMRMYIYIYTMYMYI